MHPAPANHGIVFLRSDLPGKPRIRADISKVQRTDMSTTIGNEACNGPHLSPRDPIVATVEHFMAAAAGIGLDNALIELDGAELPIMDGSSLEFVVAMEDAGLKFLDAPKKVLKLLKPVSVFSADRWVEAKPSDQFSIAGAIHFKHQVIGEQKFTFSSAQSFRDKLAGARTFGFLREVDYLHKKGLALGASLENAVVLTEESVLNPEGLRFHDEFIRHKILDAIGDFALLGLSFQASVEIHKAGHELHAGFLRKVLEDPANYEIVELGTTVSSIRSTSAEQAKEESEEEQADLPALVAHAY